MDQYIGKVLGNRYEILERIGSGGMAVVYKARCHWLNRFVAIKILKEDLTQDQEFRRRFYDEAKAVAMLSHPNIVSIYDVSRSENPDEPDYIVMELIDGITLKQYIQKRGGKLNWKESLHFITQIMKGLSHAHSRGIIHRDIKPHNIMILRDGSVKVADFGIARLVSSVQSTMTQEALGSVHYISPEQAKGSHIDARSDIYSAGVVLYEMLTGRLPYEGDSPVAVAIQHINSIPLSPRELDDSIPEAMEEITMKAMAPDMEKRYLSAEAMLADLEEFRKNPNISFDYTDSDLLVGGEDEPTRPIGANTPQVAVLAAQGKGEEKKMAKRPRQEEPEEYDDEYESEGGGFVRGLVIISAVIACLAGVAYFLWITVLSPIFAEGETFEVPPVVGYTMEEAAQRLSGTGFTLKEGEYVSDEEAPAGQIVGQDPVAGTVVKSGGQEITVNISRGTGLVVPDLYNKDRRVAVSMIEDLGLEVEIQEGNSEEITKNNVMAQSPAKGEPIEPGGTVIIVVSLGRKLETHTMIPVTNMTLEEASRIITEDLKLTVGWVRESYSDEVEAGLICYQSIEPNTDVIEGTPVNLLVSKGPEVAPSASPDPAVSSDPAVTPTPDEPPITPQPTPTPSAAPSAEPTAEPPKVTRKEGTIDLPTDREAVTVSVTVGGVEGYRQEVPTRMRSATYTVTGSGVQEIIVYIDGEEAARYTFDFG
ncbi:MAG: Stk1 family PASTA domain-containing Ser/Thr kinase [Oscillospiraceae bacterium]|nr:Stk1 family PASTA domain-containing Ser/Thr kinase [Oscillospiraceae bacterium]